MNSEEKRWLDDARNVRKLVMGLILGCAALLLADFLYHKHVHFEFEHWFGFFAFFSLVIGVGLVLIARLLRFVVGRPEDYYDR